MYRILIVEDDLVIAKSIKNHIISWGYEAECVSDFKNVISKFISYDPQLVLLDISLPFYNGMPNLCNVAIGKQSIFNICGDDFDTPDGSGMRDYIHVSDIADGHIKAMEFLEKIKGTRIYNLGSGKPISVIQLVKSFETVNKIKIPTQVTKRRDGDVAISYADISLASSELGWIAKKSIQDMCADSYRAALQACKAD